MTLAADLHTHNATLDGLQKSLCGPTSASQRAILMVREALGQYAATGSPSSAAFTWSADDLDDLTDQLTAAVTAINVIRDAIEGA